MDSTGDIYKDTIDYIKQIEKEIVFSLDDSHLELDGGCITSRDIGTYCDILLDRISQELYITSNLEKDDATNSDLHLNENNRAVITNNNNTLHDSDHQQNEKSLLDDKSCNHGNNSKQHSPHEQTDSNYDKMANYRYSFYDNSNKISIYVASSSLIDQKVSCLIIFE